MVEQLPIVIEGPVTVVAIGLEVQVSMNIDIKVSIK